MSDHTYDSECPNCGGQMNCCSGNRPHDTVSGICIDCGFTFWTERAMGTLEEVNEEREAMELKPLKKLKKAHGMSNMGYNVKGE